MQTSKLYKSMYKCSMGTWRISEQWRRYNSAVQLFCGVLSMHYHQFVLSLMTRGVHCTRWRGPRQWIVGQYNAMIQCCMIQWCMIQCCTIQCCMVQCCTVQCCMIQWCVIQCCMIHCCTVQCCMNHCCTLNDSGVWHSAVGYSAPDHIAEQCSAV